MNSSPKWFEVDKEGLAAVVQRRGLSFVITELMQNAWDEKVTRVDATLEWRDRRAVVTVEDDDPEGFTDLQHAYTLFAPSEKKDDPTRRGRFNLGEKFILAVCRSARIETTSGTVVFDKDGRHVLRGRRERGSRFVGVIPMTKTQFDQVCDDAVKVIPPAGVETTYNGVRLETPVFAGSVEATLTTEVSNEEGVLSRCRRATTVELYETRPGETASVYELGIPVCETGDRWHYNVHQKLPLTMDRESVPDGFLRDLRLLVFNAMFHKLNADDMNAEWVALSVENPQATPQSVSRYMDLKFGEKRVAYDLTDSEANKIAVSEGYTLVYGGMMSGGAWANAKTAGLIRPAGKETPSNASVEFSQTGRDCAVPMDKWTDGMRLVVEYAKVLGDELLGSTITVDIISDISLNFNACYGNRQLLFNLGRLGKKWFEQGISEAVDSLIIHEFGHEFCPDHLDAKYNDALCDLAAKLKRLALEKPEMFRQENG